MKRRTPLVLSAVLVAAAAMIAPAWADNSISLTIEVQGTEYRPNKTDESQVIISAKNNGSQQVELAQAASPGGIQFMAQAHSKSMGRHHAMRLWRRSSRTVKLPTIRLTAGETRVVLTARLSDILPRGPRGTWHRFKPRGWEWTWRAQPKPPNSPMTTKDMTAPAITSVTLWAQLGRGGRAVKSNEVQLKIVYPVGTKAGQSPSPAKTGTKEIVPCTGIGCIGVLGTGGQNGKNTGLGLGQGKGPGLSKQVLLTVITAQSKNIRGCYQAELKTNPNLSGRLKARFTIGADGSVTGTSLEAQGIKSKTMEACVAGHLKAMRFPPPLAGGTLKVVYPFVFEAE